MFNPTKKLGIKSKASVCVDVKNRHFGSGSLKKLRKTVCAFMCLKKKNEPYQSLQSMMH
jgi:hypothetical protein